MVDALAFLAFLAIACGAATIPATAKVAITAPRYFLFLLIMIFPLWVVKLQIICINTTNFPMRRK